MKLYRAVLFAVFLGYACLSCLAQEQDRDNGAAKHPVTVGDTIEMTLPGAGNSWDGNALSTKPVQFSPDGSKFAFMTQKGDLKKDVVIYSVWLYDTASALSSPKPRLIATLESSSNRPAITQIKWLSDNQTLVFLGEGPGEMPQIYKVKLGGKLEKVTDQATEIDAFSADEAGDSFVYFAKTEEKPLFSKDELRRGFFVTPTNRWDDLYLNKRKSESTHRLYVKTTGMRTAQQVGDVLEVQIPNSLDISPNGKFALFQTSNLHPPAWWDDYQKRMEGEITPSVPDCLAGHKERCARTYWLADLGNRTVRPLLNTPLILSDKSAGLAEWTKDNTVVFVNALLPLEGVSDEERSRRQHKVYSVEISLPGGEIHPLEARDEPLHVDTIARDADRLVVKAMVPQSSDVPYEFRKEGGQWKMRQITASEAEPHQPLSVRIEQGINQPPLLVAGDEAKKTILMDLNPQFADMSFGKVEVFKWQGRDGVPWGGELYYPVGYVAGNRYPLVIQTHGESRELFWIQGPFSTTSAAQPLANRGFFVLQIGAGDRYDEQSMKKWIQAFYGDQEGPFFTSGVEGAIDQLDHRGLIDRNRVGYSGFSRTVYEGEYLMTHTDYPIRAGVLADGIDFGYVGCLYYMVPSFSSICEKKNGGGSPWGPTLANWEKNSPPMRLDKIHTALLMQSILAPLGEWEIYAGLQWLKRPVDLVNFYPEGEHELVRPQEKFLSEQSAVDWYCFWLKGEEDPDPAKAEQYKRWRGLRKLQEAQTNQAREVASQ